jgi:hypothetical protein
MSGGRSSWFSCPASDGHKRQPDTIERLTDVHVRMIHHSHLLDLVAQMNDATVRIGVTQRMGTPAAARYCASL